jgi:hypothetical protein
MAMAMCYGPPCMTIFVLIIRWHIWPGSGVCPPVALRALSRHPLECLLTVTSFSSG